MPVPLDPAERSAPAESPITHTRYLAIAVPDYRDAVSFYDTTWGLRPVTNDTGISYFTAKGSTEHHILRVREATHPRIDLLALAVPTRTHVDQLADTLTHAGVPLLNPPDTLHGPAGGYGLRCFDPDGRVIEISCETTTRTPEHRDPDEPVPHRLSHVVFNTTDIHRAIRFYETHFGFRVSDWVSNFMVFLRCGTDHHTIALTNAPHASLHHISFEMPGVEAFMTGTGRLIRTGLPLLWGPGRHGPGANNFTYVKGPAGFVNEYSGPLQQINETTWTPCRWAPDGPEADRWGTAGPIDELIPAGIGQPDHGLWTPPPL